MLKQVPALKLESIEYFKYKRMAKLEWLMMLANHRHYSTFCLYDEKEFEEALEQFQENITRHFRDPHDIIWDDEYTMLVVRKTA
jgi:chemotaxis methyl-accepting protein methylase